MGKWPGKPPAVPLAPGCEAGRSGAASPPGPPTALSSAPAAPRPAARPPARRARSALSRAELAVSRPVDPHASPLGRPAPACPPRSDVRRLGAGYLWPGYSAFSWVEF